MEQVKFAQMKDGDAEDYAFLLAHEVPYANGTGGRLLEALGQLDASFDGYRVTRLVHSLQSATRAWREGADLDWVVSALLHDFGDPYAPYTHDEFAASLLKPFVREQCAWTVQVHADFQKIYYADKIGGDPNARDKHAGHMYFDDCVAFCERWDQSSFDPDYDTLSLDFFHPLVLEVFGRKPFDPDVLSPGTRAPMVDSEVARQRRDLAADRAEGTRPPKGIVSTKAIGDLLANCRLPAGEAQSLPPACYVEEAQVAVETDRIFRHAWLGIGRADRFANPGDYAALDVAGQSVIVLRDREGVLRAFANTCRHRGARLLDGEGNCRGIRCPFHSWAYKLDGSLAGAPQMNEVPGFERSDYGLIAYRAEERLGFAFICLDPSAPALDEHLGDFAQIHAPWPLETLVSTRRRALVVDCNWKAFLEVFNDYYHLPFVHPDSINEVYDRPDPADRVTGAYASQFGATEGTGGLLQHSQEDLLPPIPGLEGRVAAGVRYTWVFPNMTFAAGSDALWVYEAYPLGAGRCQVHQTACFPPETLALPGFEARVAAYYHRLDAALDEDITALVNQQRGLASPDARPGRFQPLLEPSVAAFARWYADQM